MIGPRIADPQWMPRFRPDILPIMALSQEG
jgi:hypothetical protein